MSGRLCWLACCLAIACGGNDNSGVGVPPASTSGGQASTAGAAGKSASTSGGSDASAGTGGAAGTDAGVAGAGTGGGAESDGGTAGATGGQPGGAAGASGGAASTGGGGAASGGAGGKGGAAGAPQGGTGGSATDPLEPKPVPGCPGYVAVVIPHATCVWFHGDFTAQNPECNVGDPPSHKCAIASAPGAETTSIVSQGVQITRFDFDQTGCPKQCN